MAARKHDEYVRARGKRYAPDAVGWVTDVANQLLSDFTARDKLLKDTEAVLFRRHSVEIPKAYEGSTIEIKAPIALDFVNTITAALTVNPPEVNFEPVASGSEAQNNAELREKFFSASWARQEQESGRQLFRAFMWNLVGYGEAVLKTVERSQSAWRAYTATVRDLDKRMRDPDDPDYGHRRPDEKEKAYNELTDQAKRAASYPIKTTDVPPSTFYRWLAGDGGMSIAGEIKSVPYLEALSRFGAGLGTGGKVVPEEHLGLPRSQWASVMSGTASLDLVELWDWQQVHYSLIGPGQGASGGGGRGLGRGTIVKSLPHAYGIKDTRTLRGPYFQAGGITTGQREPELMSLGILFGYLDLFKMYDQLLTLTTNAAFMTGFPAYKRNAPSGAGMISAIGAAAGPAVAPFGIDGGERDAQRPVQVVPGEVLPFDVSPIEPPKTGIDLQHAKDDVVNIFKRILPDALAGADSGELGLRPEPVGVPGQPALLPDLEQRPVRPLRARRLRELPDRGVHRGEGLRLGHATGSVSARGYNPGIRGAREGWLGIGPDELNGAHRYRVALDAEVPSNRVLEVRTQVEMLQAGLTSRTQAMEELGQDPGAVERQLLVENLKRSPEIQKRLMDRIHQLLGIAQEQQIQELGGPPGPPPGGAPPGGPPQLPGGLQMGAPDAVAPGQGMPFAPPPPGSVTGAGSTGPAMAPGGLPGNPGGAPAGVMSPPPNAMPLPGQQMGR